MLLHTAEALGSAQDARRTGRLASAEFFYRDILSRKPGRAEDAQARFNLGFLLRQCGMHESAVAHYQEAIALAPNDALAHSHLGRLLGELGRIPEARAAFEKAVALSPHCISCFGQKSRW